LKSNPERRCLRAGYVLSILGHHRVIAHKFQLSALEKLLILAPRVSSSITDIEVRLTVHIKNSKVFSHAPETDEPILPGLIPLRSRVCDMLRRLANTKVEIRPFTIAIASETAFSALRRPLLFWDYIPAFYNTSRGAALLPERMHLNVEKDIASKYIGAPETRRVLGGDDLRYALNRLGVQQTFLDVLQLEPL
jgi:hypothetical protein